MGGKTFYYWSWPYDKFILSILSHDRMCGVIFVKCWENLTRIWNLKRFGTNFNEDANFFWNSVAEILGVVRNYFGSSKHKKVAVSLRQLNCLDTIYSSLSEFCLGLWQYQIGFTGDFALSATFQFWPPCMCIKGLRLHTFFSSFFLVSIYRSETFDFLWLYWANEVCIFLIL